MRNYKILLVALPFMLMACSKGGDSPTPTPTVVVVPEADIAFKVEIAGTEIEDGKIYGAIGGTQAININITSALPKDGVTIDVKVTKDADNTVVFTKSIQSITASNPITIIGLLTEKSTATVLVTSKTKTATKTFKISAK
jgi:hypothetical protein